MKIHATRILTGALALLLAGAAPLAAHGEHPEAAGGVLHLLAHLPASPAAWAAGGAVIGLAILLRRAPPAVRPVGERRDR